MPSGTAPAHAAERASAAAAAPIIHPFWVRLTHWINVVAIFLMVTSGWRIYNASPLFAFVFPPAVTIGDGVGGLQGALLWHFGAMWLLVVNGIVYIGLGIATGRFRRKLLPIRFGDVVRDLRAALTGRLSHDDLSSYNAVQRLLYLGVIVAGVVVVLSGLSIWKPVQVQEFTAVFGGYNAARFVHFFAMAAIVGFLLVHITLAILVPKSLRAMISAAEVVVGPPAKRRGSKNVTGGCDAEPAKNRSGGRCEAADQGRRQAPAQSGAALVRRRHQPRRHHHADRLRHR